MKITTYGITNPNPGLGHTQKCGAAKLINGISPKPL